MNTTSIYDLQQTVSQAAGKKLNDQQITQLNKNQQYLQKHKIHQICNQLVAKLLETKPDKAKQQMITILRKIKQNGLETHKNSNQLFNQYQGLNIP